MDEYRAQSRPKSGMQPLNRACMGVICDVCGKARTKGNHDKCSRIRQAAGFKIERG